MAAEHDVGLWSYIGTALGGIISGAGAVIGIRMKRDTEEGEAVTRVEIEKLKESIEQKQAKMIEKMEAGFERLHHRLDELMGRLSKLEGYVEARKDKD